MEKFLKDYVVTLAEDMDIKLTESKLQEIVNRLMDCDSIWEILDEHIVDELESEG